MRGRRTSTALKACCLPKAFAVSNVKVRYKTLQIDKLVTGEGRPLPPRLAHEIKREIDRLALVQQQIAAIEQERDESPTTCKETEKKRALSAPTSFSAKSNGGNVGIPLSERRVVSR